MAILMRGGLYADFDPSKLKPREWAVVLGNDPGSSDGRTVYLCFGNGVVKRIATHEDMSDIILNATEDIREEFMEMFNEILAEMRRLKTDVEGYKNTAVAKAGEAAVSADEAKASKAAAAQSAQSATASAATATTKASEAAASASAAATSETQAAAQAAAAKAFKDAADASQKAAKASESNAKDSEAKAKESETAAAQSAATAAQDSIDAANKANEASASAEAAAMAAATATAKAGEASDFSDLSKSYAVGTEGAVREGDATDNSKYYSEQSKASADESKTYLAKVEQAGDNAVDKINDALNVAKPNFLMDLATGHLLYDGSWFDFSVIDGHLGWEMVA